MFYEATEDEIQFMKSLIDEDDLLDAEEAFNLGPIREAQFDKHRFNSSEQLCLVLLKSGVETLDEMKNMLQAVDLIKEYNLSKEATRAQASPERYFQLMKEVSKIDELDVLDCLREGRERKTRDTRSACQAQMFLNGLSLMGFGLDPELFEEFLGDDTPISLLDAFKDPLTLVEDLHESKLEDMENAEKAIIRTLDVRESSKYDLARVRHEKIESILDEFDSGEMVTSLNPEKYKPPKEAGCMSPHTLEPKDWAAAVTSSIVNKEYGSKAGVMFRDSSATDSRSYTGGIHDYIVYSDDPESPYAIDTNPSIYCQEYEDDGVWKWRTDVKQTQAEVNLYVTEAYGKDASQLIRHKYLNDRLKDKASIYVDTDPPKQHPTIKSCWIVPPESRKTFKGKTMLLNFYKRGHSKATKVHENPEYIHMVTAGVAKGFKDDQFVKIMLCDFNTVILFPTEVWSINRWATMPQSLGVPYNTTWGMAFVEGLSKFGLYFALLQMSMTRAMFRSWKERKKFVPQDYLLKIDENIKKKNPQYWKLFGRFDMNKTGVRESFFRLLLHCPGPVCGLFLAPSLSKSGKASLDIIMQNGLLAQSLSEFKEVVFEDDGFDVDLDILSDLHTREEDYVPSGDSGGLPDNMSDYV